MTPPQAEVFKFIKAYIVKRGCSPTVEEVARYISRTKSYTCNKINELVDQNYLKKDFHKYRSIEIVQHYCPYCKGNLSTFESQAK